MKILELFGGIGACSKALERIGVDYEIADYVEIDKYAVKSYNAMHGTNFEPQDVTKWDKDIEVDLIMHGSPCQDFSVAGKNAGGDKGSGTRSSLMYETLRIVEKLKPKYVIWENVKNLLGKKHRHNFDAYQEAMCSLGYRNYYQILNAKDYGVPQNRERVFTVSIREDIKGDFVFPEKQPLEHRLKDILEDNVDERYYLSDEQISRIKLSTFDQARTRIQEGDVPQTLCARDFKDPKCVQVAQMYGTDREPNPQAGRVYDSNGLSPTMDTCSGGNRMPKVAEPIIVASRGRGENNEQQLEPNLNGTTNTLTTVQKDNLIVEPTALQKEVCNKAIQNGLVEPNDAIEYTYSNARLKEIDSGYIKKQNVKDNTIMSTLKTNPQQIGVCVDAEPIKIKTANIKGYDEADDGDAIDLQYPESKTRRGRGEDNEQQLEPNFTGATNTLTSVQKDNYVAEPTEPKLDFVGGIGDKDWARDGKKLSRNYPQGSRVYSSDGIATSLSAKGVGGVGGFTGAYRVDEPIKIKTANIKGYDEASDGDAIDLQYPESKTRRGRVGHGVSKTLMTSDQMAVVNGYRIRKLTPLECWRLMGFDDADYAKAAQVNSNTQLYKQAGNSIVVNVLEGILGNLLCESQKLR